jgi:NADH-quinone oxidoreductase subunit L
VSLQALTLALLLLPAAGALALALTALRIPRPVVQVLGPGVVWLSFVATVILFGNSLASGHTLDFTYWTWIKSGAFTLPANLFMDRLSIFMCLVVTGVGGLIITYAVGYMSHESDGSYARFFCYMDLFIFSMLLLVMAGNLVFLIMGWAMVGLSSYLLIGFYYWRHSAVVAARKAFVMNVVGDIGMILAAFAIFANYHTLTYSGVFAAVPKTDGFWIEVIGYLLLVGAVAKSAQLPLHTWLPDAMEGPTPVSALIHAATMVTAGVYLIGRMHPIYDVAYVSHYTAATLGTVTALMAATIAVVQTDIKRVLAYSTMSQIGYMFLGVGIGAYAAAFYHLVAHAFFKALLFMGAGNVIHAMEDEQDMRRFGGLWRQMRLTSVCFLIGSLALVGVFPLVGFFSKELILGDAFSDPNAGAFPQVLWAVGFLTAVLTGFYTGRMWWLSFWGKPSAGRPVEHPHAPRLVMMVPVAILAILSTIGGFVQTRALGFGPAAVDDFLKSVVGPVRWEGGGAEIAVTFVTMLLAAGLFVWALYCRPWSSYAPWAQRWLEHKYYFDELYDRVFVRPTDWVAGFALRDIETPVIDAAVIDTGLVARAGSAGLSLTQSGYFRNYVLVFVAGALIATVLLIVRTVS